MVYLCFENSRRKCIYPVGKGARELRNNGFGCFNKRRFCYKVIALAVKPGLTELYMVGIGGNRSCFGILVVGHKIVQRELGCNAKRKQDQKKSCKYLSYDGFFWQKYLLRCGKCTLFYCTTPANRFFYIFLRIKSPAIALSRFDHCTYLLGGQVLQAGIINTRG